MPRVEVSVFIPAPPDEVWAQVSDHAGMASWGMLSRSTLLRPGSPDPNGLGARRRLEGPGQRIEEEVVAWDPPRAYEYRLLSGAPVRSHRGRMAVVAEGRGARVDWTVDFEPAVPFTGTVMAAALRLGFGRMLEGLRDKVVREARARG
jgi:uncharacterized protein YndB with AHSA1/START domain